MHDSEDNACKGEVKSTSPTQCCWNRRQIRIAIECRVRIGEHVEWCGIVEEELTPLPTEEAIQRHERWTVVQECSTQTCAASAGIECE